MNPASALQNKKLWYLLGLGLVLFAYANFWQSLAYGPLAAGTWDWIQAFGPAEAMRRSVLHYGQFPWWDPYVTGGVPLFATAPFAGNGVLAISFPLILIFGTVAGVKLAVVLNAIIGYAGAYLLAGQFTKSIPIRVAAAVLIICNGALLLHLSAGHYVMDFPYYPWLVLFLIRAARAEDTRRMQKYSLLAGAAFALMINVIVHYSVAYGLMTIFLVLLLAPEKWLSLRRWISHGFLIGGSFLLLAGLRIGVTLAFSSDFPRWDHIDSGLSLPDLWMIFTQRGSNLHANHDFALVQNLAWHELGCYIGIVPVLLFLYSLARRPRFYHFITLLFIVLFISAKYPYPYYFMNKYLPIFKTMRVAPRLRIWTVVFITLGAIDGLNRISGWRWRNRPAGQWVAAALCLFIAVDIATEGNFLLKGTFMPPNEISRSVVPQANPKPYPVTYQQPEEVLPDYYLIQHQNFAIMPGYFCTLSGEPIMTKHPLIFGINQPEYKGEFYTASGPVEPDYWSPNHIVFRNIHEPLRINMNPGAYWRVNGEKPYAGMRSVELDMPFIVQPDSSGTIDLKIVPKGISLSIALTLVGLVIFLFRKRLTFV